MVQSSFKEMVHPKMKTVIIYSPSSKPIWLSFFSGT